MRVARHCAIACLGWQLLPNTIVTLHTQGDRIIAGDVQESVHYLKYKSQDNVVRGTTTRAR